MVRYGMSRKFPLYYLPRAALEALQLRSDRGSPYFFYFFLFLLTYPPLFFSSGNPAVKVFLSRISLKEKNLYTPSGFALLYSDAKKNILLLGFGFSTWSIVF